MMIAQLLSEEMQFLACKVKGFSYYSAWTVCSNKGKGGRRKQLALKTELSKQEKSINSR